MWGEPLSAAALLRLGLRARGLFPCDGPSSADGLRYRDRYDGSDHASWLRAASEPLAGECEVEYDAGRGGRGVAEVEAMDEAERCALRVWSECACDEDDRLAVRGTAARRAEEAIVEGEAGSAMKENKRTLFQSSFGLQTVV